MDIGLGEYAGVPPVPITRCRVSDAETERNETRRMTEVPNGPPTGVSPGVADLALIADKKRDGILFSGGRFTYRE